MRIAILLCSLGSVFSYAMEPVGPENPFVKIQNDAGDFRWINKELLQVLLDASEAQPLTPQADGSLLFNYSKQAIDIFTNLLVIHESFRLQNVVDQKYVADHLYSFYKTTISPTIENNSLLELMTLVGTFFPKYYLLPLMQVFVEKIGNRSIDFSSAPQNIRKYETYFKMQQRFRFPPTDSILTKFVKHKGAFPMQVQAVGTGQASVVIANLSNQSITSIFGLGSFLRKIELFAAQRKLPKPVYVSVILNDNQIASIDEVDVAESNTYEHLLVMLSLNNNGLASISQHFLKNAGHLNRLFLMNNKLQQLPEAFLDNAKQLITLHLNHNDLKQFPAGFLGNASTLLELSFAFNAIEQLEAGFLQNNQKLISINAEFNPDVQLPQSFLSQHPGLNQINFSKCGLSQLPSDFLQQTRAIRILNLSRNKLEKLPDGFLRNVESINDLILYGNPVFENAAYLATLPLKVQEAIKYEPAEAEGE